jgi:hypothetical protein
MVETIKLATHLATYETTKANLLKALAKVPTFMMVDTADKLINYIMPADLLPALQVVFPGIEMKDAVSERKRLGHNSYYGESNVLWFVVSKEIDDLGLPIKITWGKKYQMSPQSAATVPHIMLSELAVAGIPSFSYYGGVCGQEVFDKFNDYMRLLAVTTAVNDALKETFGEYSALFEVQEPTDYDLLFELSGVRLLTVKFMNGAAKEVCKQWVADKLFENEPSGRGRGGINIGVSKRLPDILRTMRKATGMRWAINDYQWTELKPKLRSYGLNIEDLEFTTIKRTY